MSVRDLELTERLRPLIAAEIADKNFVNTLRLRKKFNCSGKRVSVILRELGFSWFSTSSRYQTYKRDSHLLEA